MTTHIQQLFALCTIIAMTFCNTQWVFAQKDFKEEGRYFNASIGLGNSIMGDSESATPGILINFERRGVLGSNVFGFDLGLQRFFVTGMYFNYQKANFTDVAWFGDYDITLIGFGARIGFDVFEIIEEVSDNDFSIENLEVYPGIQWGYTIWATDFDWAGVGAFKPCAYLAARYYLNDNIGAQLELGRTAFTTFNVGATFRF